MKRPQLKPVIAVLLALSLVAGVPGLDFYKAFAASTRDRAGHAQAQHEQAVHGETDLDLGVDADIRQAVVGDVPVVDADRRIEPVRGDAVPGEQHAAVVELAASDRVPTPPSPRRANGDARDAVNDASLHRPAETGLGDIFWPEALGERAKAHGALGADVLPEGTAALGAPGLTSSGLRAPGGEESEDAEVLRKVLALRASPDGEPVSVLDLDRDLQAIRASLGAKPVFAINRSPITLDGRGERAEIRRSNGGAAPAIKGTLDNAGGGLVVSVAAAETLAERALARSKKILRVGDVWVLYLDIPQEVMDRYYSGFANRWLWPILHGENVVAEFFKDSGGKVEGNNEDFKGYRQANSMIAEAISGLLGPDHKGSLSLEDYHLYLLAPQLRARGYDGLLEHFTHIPWPEWDYLNKFSGLNREMLRRVVEGLLANDIVGFHTYEYVENFALTAQGLLGAQIELGLMGATVTYRGRKTVVRAYPISVDVRSIVKEMETEEARTHYERLRRLARERTLLSDVARIDPTKGLPQSLESYYQLLKALEKNPGFLGKAKPPLFYGLFQPSRGTIEEYRGLQQEILTSAEKINGRFSKGKWHGIIRSQADYEEFLSLSPDRVPAVVVQMTGASHPKVLATFAATNVGNVVPLADGMNLVAKEFVVAAAYSWKLAEPAWRLYAWAKQKISKWILGVGAVLIISKTIGAHAELAPYVLTVKNPTSITERVELMRRGILAANGEARAPKAEDGIGQITANDLGVWADDRRAAIERARAPPAAAAQAKAVSSWERFADRLKLGAPVAFLLMHLAQIWWNQKNLAAGAGDQIGILDVAAREMGILGDLATYWYFVANKQGAVAWGPAIGILAASLIFGQMWWAGTVAGWVFFPTVGLSAAVLVVSNLRNRSKSPALEKLWNGWSEVLGVLVMTALPFVLWLKFGALLPPVLGYVALGLTIAMAAAAIAFRFGEHLLPEFMRGLKKRVGALMVTLGVGGNVAQLQQNVAHPTLIGGFAPWALFFAGLGNLLLLPAAALHGFKNKDWYWFAGSTLAVLLGGIGIGVTMALFGVLSWPVVAAFSALTLAWIGVSFVQGWRHS